MVSKKELSIFVDESGDFGPYASHSPYYLVTMLFHNQTDSIEQPLQALDRAMLSLSFDQHAIHTGPLIRKESVYSSWPIEDRRILFNKLFHFMRHCNISYKCFVFEKKEFADQVAQVGRMAKILSSFLREREDFFTSFDRIVIYYDNGQVELNRILSTVFNVLFSNVEFRQVLPVDYRLFQVADLFCTLELLHLKQQKNELTKSERLFFQKTEILKKTYIKPALKKRI